MRFAEASYLRRQGMLEVTFENGDRFLVPVESILPATASAKGRRRSVRTTGCIMAESPQDWPKLRIGPTGDTIEVPANDTVIEIPWDRIRALADPDFRAHLSDRAAERARRIGGRIRAMRLKAGLTRAALAEKVAIPRQTIAALETGQIEPDLDLIESIAAALGKRLCDFAEE